METLRRDLRFAIRALIRHRGFAAVALVTLALGIGVTTAIFSVVHAVVLQPLSYPAPDRLYTVWENHEPRDGSPTEWTGLSTFTDWRDRNRSFGELSAVTDWNPDLTGTDQPEVLQGARVSHGFFRVLARPPVVGRDFTPEDETPGIRSVILAHEFWNRRFGGDRSALGRTLILNGVPHTIVGVAAPGFQGPLVPNAEIWGVLPVDPERDDRGSYYLRVVGRLAEGFERDAAQSDMARVAATIAEEHPADYGEVGITLEPLADSVVGAARTPLLILMGAVGLVLLISCANVANLLLARASVRERELAVRASLGAGRRKIIRQLLTESVVLGVVGGTLGLLLGVWGTSLLVQLAPAGLPRAAEIGIDPTVLLFGLGASVVTGLLFGLAPAFGYAAEASRSLREGSRGSSAGGMGGRLRNGLVVAELALGVAVLVSAGLLLRSFQEIRSVDPGFRVENAMTARVLFPTARYEDPWAIPGVVEQLESRLAGIPGVESVGVGNVLPLSGQVNDISWGVEGRLPEPGRELLADSWHATPGFFEALGIPLLQGRVFDDGDRDGSVPVAVISRSLAEREFAGQNPIGQRIKVGGVRDPESPWWTIVGVVETVRTRAVARAPEPEIFRPLAQRPSRGLSIVLRTAGDPASFAGALRETVWSVDADMSVSQVATLDEVFAASVAAERFISLLLGVFAALALVLGAVGIYGVMAFMVSRRSRDIGIRMALGASPRRVLAGILGRGMALTAAGLAIGLLGALAAGRALSSLLFEVRPTDPVTLVGVAGLLGLTSLLACLWPARRATRVDPMATLRAE